MLQCNIAEAGGLSERRSHADPCRRQRSFLRPASPSRLVPIRPSPRGGRVPARPAGRPWAATRPASSGEATNSSVAVGASARRDAPEPRPRSGGAPGESAHESSAMTMNFRIDQTGAPGLSIDRPRALECRFRNSAGSRAYDLFVPSGPGDGPRPLVVMLHGSSQSARDFAIGTNMDRLAEEQGFSSPIRISRGRPTSPRAGTGSGTRISSASGASRRSWPASRGRSWAASASIRHGSTSRASRRAAPPPPSWR